MGFSIAKRAANLGAEVFLITGPSDEQVSHSGIHRINVTTAEEMYNKAHQYFPTSDIAILAAAVADYRPKNVSAEKIKKEGIIGHRIRTHKRYSSFTRAH